MPRLRDRPTPDLVVLILSGVVAFTVGAAVFGGVWLKLADPGYDLERLGARLADVTNTLIGAIVGYLAGRGVNGYGKKPPNGGTPDA